MSFTDTVNRHPLRWVIAAWIGYIVSFPLAHATPLGDMYAAAALLPVVMTAHLFGSRGARFVAVGFIPVQSALFLTTDHEVGLSMFAGVEGLFGLVVLVLVGLYVGKASDIRIKLQRLHAERDRFIAAVAHDVKNPLTGVIGLSLALAEDPQLSNESRELATMIAAEAQAATDVIEDLSVTALRNSGTFTVHPEAFDVLDEVSPVAAKIDAAVTAASERTVWADRRRFRQILANLITNAERHGAPPYELVIERTLDDVFVRLRDHGDGIPQDMLEHLFEPFGMVGVSDHVDSTGLGLSSSRVLATIMHGDLTYRRRQNITEFSVRLPAHQPTAMTTSEQMSENPSA